MSTSDVSFHGAKSMSADLALGIESMLGPINWLTITLTNAPGMFGDKDPPDSFTIHFEPSALDKFTTLAEAINHIFGDKTQEKTNV